MDYPAHIRQDADCDKVIQTVAQHDRAVADYASAKNVAGLKQTAYLAGLLHDLGKCTEDFSEYINKAAAGEPVRRGSVNHTFAGVRFVMERWHSPKPRTPQNMACDLIAYAIGAHHGLFDCLRLSKSTMILLCKKRLPITSSLPSREEFSSLEPRSCHQKKGASSYVKLTFCDTPFNIYQIFTAL